MKFSSTKIRISGLGEEGAIFHYGIVAGQLLQFSRDAYSESQRYEIADLASVPSYERLLSSGNQLKHCTIGSSYLLDCGQASEIHTTLNVLSSSLPPLDGLLV